MILQTSKHYAKFKSQQHNILKMLVKGVSKMLRCLRWYGELFKTTYPTKKCNIHSNLMLLIQHCTNFFVMTYEIYLHQTSILSTQQTPIFSISIEGRCTQKNWDATLAQPPHEIFDPQIPTWSFSECLTPAMVRCNMYIVI